MIYYIYIPYFKCGPKKNNDNQNFGNFFSALLSWKNQKENKNKKNTRNKIPTPETVCALVSTQVFAFCVKRIPYHLTL